MPSELNHERREVPGTALQFNIGEFSLGDNGDGAKTAPIRLLARAGAPIEHPYWGKVVHDFAGMQHKNRIPIDYRHDEPIGYVNQFDTASGDLQLSGALVPFKESDKATEIIHKSRGGVPYEASIDFRAPVVMEELPAGKSAEVNGRSLEGPATIIRSWTLRGVAVCPYGADPNTSSQLSAQEKYTVEILNSAEHAKAMNATETPVEDAASVEAVEETKPVEEQPAAEVATENAGSPAIEVVPQQQEADGKAFLAAFGADGAVWFVEGKSFQECVGLYSAKQKAEIERLSEENQKLKQRISGAQLGESEPIQFSTGEGKRQGKGFAGMFSAVDTKE